MLVELTRVEGTSHGTMIAQQMLDVAVRVQSIRHFAVSQMVEISFCYYRRYTNVCVCRHCCLKILTYCCPTCNGVMSAKFYLPRLGFVANSPSMSCSTVLFCFVIPSIL